jgi:hypothetical protein
MKKEEYHKPEIMSEEIEMGAFAGGSPVPVLQPFFGLCPPCGGSGE